MPGPDSAWALYAKARFAAGQAIGMASLCPGSGMLLGGAGGNHRTQLAQPRLKIIEHPLAVYVRATVGQVEGHAVQHILQQV